LFSILLLKNDISKIANLFYILKTELKNSHLSATINHKGAELISLKNANHKEYIWEGNPEYWGKHSPILFPIVGTLKNNTYTFNENSYQLPRHGFARDISFELIQQTTNTVTFSLKSSEKTKLVYPFDFELQINYTLEENKLVIGYKIINKDTIAIPFSIGAHPAFSLPKNFEEYDLLFDKSEDLIIYTLENDLISDTVFTLEIDKNKLPLSYSLFENDALIIKKLQSKSITILENETPLLKVQFDDFKNLGLWTKNNAPFICIEPWLGYSDTIHSKGIIENKEGIQFVESQNSFDCSFYIEIL
jgi:galactose mutarotase-like enzyme